MSRLEAGVATLHLAAEDIIAAEIGLTDAVTMLRRELMLVALVKTNGNQMRAAKILKLHRNTFSRSMTPELYKMVAKTRKARAEEMANKRKQPVPVHAKENTKVRYQQSVQHG
jgi:DNA-binding NtrC family response regulator